MRADRSRKNPVAPHILSGWKDIANYLGKGVRTVQRYEVELGLPVRRPAGRSSGSVVATKAELDAWVSASPIRDVFHLSRTTSALSTSTCEQIKNSVLEMRNLRAQMADLRAELRNSLALLSAGIQGIQGELDRDHWQENEATKVSVLDSKFRTKRNLGILATDLNQKVS
jgi:hypothetical protein